MLRIRSLYGEAVLECGASAPLWNRTTTETSQLVSAAAQQRQRAKAAEHQRPRRRLGDGFHVDPHLTGFNRAKADFI